MCDTLTLSVRSTQLILLFFCCFNLKIVSDCISRLTESQTTEIIALIKQYLPPTPPANTGADDVVMQDTAKTSNNDENYDEAAAIAEAEKQLQLEAQEIDVVNATQGSNAAPSSQQGSVSQSQPSQQAAVAESKAADAMNVV